MAYEVYCENIDKMRENDIPFILPEKTKQIAGTEMLLKNAGDASLEARMNTRILVELLRPYWERNNGTNVKDVDESKKPFFEKAPQVTLFASGEADSDGKAISLEIDENALDDCLKCRIQEGVDNFFAKLKTSFTNKSAKLPIHIFLAGNSCKSPLLQEIMQDTLSQIEPKFEQKLQNVNEELEIVLSSINRWMLMRIILISKLMNAAQVKQALLLACCVLALKRMTCRSAVKKKKQISDFSWELNSMACWMCGGATKNMENGFSLPMQIRKCLTLSTLKKQRLVMAICLSRG